MQSCCAEYSVSSKTPSDSQESHDPPSAKTSEAVSTRSSNHASAQPSVHVPANTRTFHTLARNASSFHFQQQRCLKGSVAADGSTILSEASKLSDSADRDDKSNMQDSTASASSSSNSSQLRNNAKVGSNSGVVFSLKFCFLLCCAFIRGMC